MDTQAADCSNIANIANIANNPHQQNPNFEPPNASISQDLWPQQQQQQQRWQRKSLKSSDRLVHDTTSECEQPYHRQDGYHPVADNTWDDNFQQLYALLDSMQQNGMGKSYGSTDVHGGTVHLGDQHYYHITMSSPMLQQQSTMALTSPSPSLTSFVPRFDKSESIKILISQCPIDHAALLTLSTISRKRSRLATQQKGQSSWLPRVRKHWQDTPDSSLLLMKGAFHDRTAQRSLCVDMIHHLNTIHITTLHVLTHLTRPYTTQDILKSLILQVFLTLPEPTESTDQYTCSQRVNRFEGLSSTPDHVALLAECLSHIRLVFIIVNIEGITDVQDRDECRQALRNLISHLHCPNTGTNTNPILRILLTSPLNLSDLSDICPHETVITTTDGNMKASVRSRRLASARGGPSPRSTSTDHPDIFVDLGRKTRQREKATGE